MSGSAFIPERKPVRLSNDHDVKYQAEASSSRSSNLSMSSRHGKQSASNRSSISKSYDAATDVHDARGRTDLPPPEDAGENDDESTQYERSNKHAISLFRGALCAVALGGLIFFQSTNISMLTTIQSDIAESLDAYDKTSWFTSAYLITMSSLGPLNGKLSTVFSPRLCVFVSSFVLALGGLITGSASSFEIFILGRAVAGMGAAGVLTLAIVLILDLTGPKRRGLAIGLLNSGFTFGVAMGAILAGALQPVIGWRALFYIQTPVCLLCGITLLLAIPSTFAAKGSSHKTSTQDDDDDTSHGTLARLRSLDYLGAVTLTASIASLLYALSSPTTIPLLPLLLAIILFTTFLLTELYLASDPIIPIPLLRSRGLLCSCLSTVGFMMARWGVLFFSPTYALALRHWSRASAGAILVPTNAGFALGGLLVGALHIRRSGSFYLPTLACYALFPATLVLVAALATPDSPAWLYVVAVGLCGLVTGATLNYGLAHLLHLTPPRTHYVATALLATFRGFAGSFGSAIGGGLFTRALDKALREGFAEKGLSRDALVQKLLGSPTLVNSLTGVEQEVAMDGYGRALKTLFLSGAALALAMVFVQAGSGWKGPEEEESFLEQERRPLLSDDEDDEE